MATVTIRGLDDAALERLRLLAARHGRSIESEALAILQEALAESTAGLGTRIHHRFAALGGMDLHTPRRDKIPRTRLRI